MKDPIATVVEWLSSDSGVTALVDSRIYGGLLPQDVVVDQDGPAITVQIRGGNADAEVPLIRPSVQIEVWAGPYQFQQAREVYRAIFDLMHGKNSISLTNGYILSSVEEVPGQDGVDPDTNWATVVSFWKLIMRAA
jgi:hypothetical protein